MAPIAKNIYALRKLQPSNLEIHSDPKTRFLTFSAVTLWIALSLVSQSKALAQGHDPAGMPVVRKIKALEFTNSFGVNIHLSDSNYKSATEIANALDTLGLSRVRSSCTSRAEVNAWKELAAKTSVRFPAGLRANVFINGYMNAPDVTFLKQQKLVMEISGLLESIEGPNEINNHGVGEGNHGPFDRIDRTDHWTANYVEWAKAIFSWRQRTPALSRVRLIAPSIASGDPADYARLPDVSASVSAGNMHFYAGNARQPSNFGGGNFAAIYDWYRAAAVAGKPVSVTECGQTTARKVGQGGCDEANQAKYVLNQMCDAVAKGVECAYFYQLMDDTADGDPTGTGGSEAHFGLFDYRWRAKPSAVAISNLKNLLHDSSVGFIPKVPNYQVLGLENAGSAGSNLAISKSDGSTILVVWNEPPIWNSGRNVGIAPAANHVVLNFGGDYTYKIYDPLIGPQPITSGKGSHVQINLVGSPLFIHLLPETF